MIRRWRTLAVFLSALLAGALLRGEEPPPTVDEPSITASDRDHWAFRPVKRPAIPDVRAAEWCRTPIDRFVLAAQERDAVHPAPEADRRTLIRRLSFDLTGLPPNSLEIEQFLHDPAPDAFERLVDRFLASPAYGERWAQHWLDLARFAETDGFEHDLERPHAWRYRDWVISALNADLPYDEFVRRQLAGDELSPDDPEAAIATGFLLCGPDMPDINLQEERRHHFLNDLTGTVGAALLGLQVGCAACHDHKYDPISQFDFYRLRACFEPMEIFRDHPLPPRSATDSEARPFGRIVREFSPESSPGRLYLRGDFRRPGPETDAGWLRVVSTGASRVDPPTQDHTTTRRRIQLANWITSPQNPLTTRVLVNRVWQHHFGVGLVATPSDFGKFGADPSHPELLDWLADEFLREGWSLKRLHRLMLNSATWRQASLPPQSDTNESELTSVYKEWNNSVTRDPANRLLTRFRRRRLDGEEIRDALLAVSRELCSERGGQGVRPPLPPEVVQTLLANQWKTSPRLEDHRRRSIYLFVRRNLRYPLFEAFDRPDTNASCPQRGRSTIAPQSLVMLNAELSLETAKHCAGRLLSRGGSSREVLANGAFQSLLGKTHPTAEESQAAVEFLDREAARKRAESSSGAEFAMPAPLPAGVDRYDAAALVELCLALVNVSEFQYVD